MLNSLSLSFFLHYTLTWTENKDAGLNMSGVKLKSQARAGVPGQPLQPSDGTRDGMNLRVSLSLTHPVFILRRWQSHCRGS